MHIQRSCHFLVVVAAAMLTAAAAQAAPRYHIADLGLARSPDSLAIAAMNGSGQAVGAADSDTKVACILYDHGTDTDLGSLGGANCYVGGINDLDVVVGSSSLADGSSDLHAFAYRDGVMVDLGTYPGYASSAAVAVNNSGAIVGNSWSPMTSKVFVYHNGLFKHIPMPQGALSMSAGDINDHGQITGSALYEQDHPRAFLYSHGQAIDLGTLNNASYNSQSVGNSINIKGDVVGWSSGSTFVCHAMMFRAGMMVDLGALPEGNPFASSVASSINDRGLVVGMSDDGGGNRVAFIYDGKKMRDLNTLRDAASRGWHLEHAQAINKSGQITGLARSAADQQLHVFLATPEY